LIKTEKSEVKEYDKICKLIINFGKAAHSFGTPDGQIVEYLLRLSKKFEIDGEYRSSPNHIMFAFRENDDYWQKINLANVPGSTFNMTKLAKLDKLVNEILSDNLSIEDAIEKINSFDKIENTYGEIWIAVSYVFVATGFAAILAGGWMDILFSGIFSIIVFLMIQLSQGKGGILSDSIPVTTAFVTGFLSILCKYYIPELNYVLVTLSAIIILIPGYGISVGIQELLNNHAIPGLGNLLNGIVYLLKQFAGAWFGFMLAGIFITIPAAVSLPIDPVFKWMFLALLFFGLVIVFQTSYKDFIWAFICCFLGYIGVLYGSYVFSNNFGNLLGSFAIGTYANIWQRKTGRPGSIIFLPAIMVLVGGSSGFRGLIAAAQGAPDAQKQFMEMFMIAFTITAGLIIANTVVKAKRKFVK
jgi:uncharacterized membrane protein YjjP (DUF1212 family)